MATREGGSGSSTLLAFALGALAGAAIALLYAPASGDETRRRLRKKAEEGRDRVTEAFDRGREVFEQARKEHL